MKPITRVKVDRDSGHAPFYAASIAWSLAQLEQDTKNTGLSSIHPQGPYAGSGDVRVGSLGIGVHRQYDLREPHYPIPQPSGQIPPVESPVVLGGGSFPWLEQASSTVFINTQGCGRAGDLTVCGAVILTGDKEVLVGD